LSDFKVELQQISKTIPNAYALQCLLYDFEYRNTETMKSAKTYWETGFGHCLEAVHFIAAVMEQKGFPPLALCLDSADNICHVVYVFKGLKGWGSLGRSREPGLQGRAPVFRSIRDLAWSYYDPYIDDTGRLTGYALVNLDNSRANWRTSPQNVWKSEAHILEAPQVKLSASKNRYEKAKKNFECGGHEPRPSWW
jgi:hypothetical protein